MRYHGTDIDGPSLDPDTLNVRGHNLMDFVGNYSFLASFFHTLYGELPTPDQEAEMNRYMSEAFCSIHEDDPIFEIVPLLAHKRSQSLNALLAGMSIDRSERILEMERPDFGDKAVTAYETEGFYHDAVLAIVGWLAAECPDQRDMAILRRRLREAQMLGGDFVDRIAYLYLGHLLTDPREKVLLEAILTACHCGFGYLTPTVMAPRIAIGSGVSIGTALLAGYTTAGPWHAGAGLEVIDFVQRLHAERKGDLRTYARDVVADHLKNGKPLFGFGHPLFKKDPRPVRMAALVRELDYGSDYLDLFFAIMDEASAQRNINPNAEGVNAAVMLSMGFQIPFHSPALVLVSRTAAMLAHMKERMDRPPFGVKSNVAREYLDKVPTGWI